MSKAPKSQNDQYIIILTLDKDFEGLSPEEDLTTQIVGPYSTKDKAEAALCTIDLNELFSKYQVQVKKLEKLEDFANKVNIPLVDKATAEKQERIFDWPPENNIDEQDVREFVNERIEDNNSFYPFSTFKKKN